MDPTELPTNRRARAAASVLLTVVAILASCYAIHWVFGFFFWTFLPAGPGLAFEIFRQLFTYAVGIWAIRIFMADFIRDFQAYFFRNRATQEPTALWTVHAISPFSRLPQVVPLATVGADLQERVFNRVRQQYEQYFPAVPEHVQNLIARVKAIRNPIAEVRSTQPQGPLSTLTPPEQNKRDDRIAVVVQSSPAEPSRSLLALEAGMASSLADEIMEPQVPQTLTLEGALPPRTPRRLYGPGTVEEAVKNFWAIFGDVFSTVRVLRSTRPSLPCFTYQIGNASSQFVMLDHSQSDGGVRSREYIVHKIFDQRITNNDIYITFMPLIMAAELGSDTALISFAAPSSCGYGSTLFDEPDGLAELLTRHVFQRFNAPSDNSDMQVAIAHITRFHIVCLLGGGQGDDWSCTSKCSLENEEQLKAIFRTARSKLADRARAGYYGDIVCRATYSVSGEPRACSIVELGGFYNRPAVEIGSGSFADHSELFAVALKEYANTGSATTRGSKIFTLLEDCFERNGKFCVICHITPEVIASEQSRAALEYASSISNFPCRR